MIMQHANSLELLLLSQLLEKGEEEVNEEVLQSSVFVTPGLTPERASHLCHCNHPNDTC